MYLKLFEKELDYVLEKVYDRKIIDKINLSIIKNKNNFNKWSLN